MNVPVNRLPQRIEPDPHRTIARFFNPGGDPRACAIVERVGRLPESEASALLKRVEDEFGKKYRNIREIFLEHYQAVCECVPSTAEISEARQLLIGAYFTMDTRWNRRRSLIPRWFRHETRAECRKEARVLR